MQAITKTKISVPKARPRPILFSSVYQWYIIDAIQVMLNVFSSFMLRLYQTL